MHVCYLGINPQTILSSMSTSLFIHLFLFLYLRDIQLLSTYFCILQIVMKLLLC